MRLEAETGHLFVRYVELGWVLSLVQARLHLQAALRFGGGDEIDDDLMTSERLSAPVHGDVRKQAMLDLVPLARAGSNVTDRHLQAEGVGETLKSSLPPPEAIALAAAAVSADE